MTNYNVIMESPPLSRDDLFVMFERWKTEFDFPVHAHSEYEINFIAGAEGAVRVVGDSVEEISDMELVLITGSNLYHTWKNGDLKEGSGIYEVTIQFSPDLLMSGGLLDKTHFALIKKMFQDGHNGISFSEQTARKCGAIIQQMLAEKDRIESFLLFLSMLNIMSHDSDYRVLANPKFSSFHDTFDSKTINSLMEFLNKNYHRKITLEEAAAVVNMSVPSFVRFVRTRTGFSFVNCLNNIRVGCAARMLVDEPLENISSIAYRCGFRNLSNFNRIFKAKKGITPKEFRSYYNKN